MKSSWYRTYALGSNICYRQLQKYKNLSITSYFSYHTGQCFTRSSGKASATLIFTYIISYVVEWQISPF